MFYMSLYVWMTQTRGFVYYTYWSTPDAHGDFSVCRLTKWGHKYMNNISRTAPRVLHEHFTVSFEYNYRYIIYTEKFKGPLNKSLV